MLTRVSIYNAPAGMGLNKVEFVTLHPDTYIIQLALTNFYLSNAGLLYGSLFSLIL